MIIFDYKGFNVGLLNDSVISESNIFFCAKDTNKHPRQVMKFKGFLINVSFLWVEGMAIFPFILSKRKVPGVIFLNHECIHFRQQLELGLLFFYIWYFAEYFVRLLQTRNHHTAYSNISFEREAYRNESNLDYLVNRRFWAFLKYLMNEKNSK